MQSWIFSDECLYRNRHEQYLYIEMILFESLLDRFDSIINVVKKYKDTLKQCALLQFSYTYTCDDDRIHNNTEIQRLNEEIDDLRTQIISSDDYHYISPVREECKVFLIKYESIFYKYSYEDIQRSKQTEEHLASLDKQINEIYKLIKK